MPCEVMSMYVLVQIILIAIPPVCASASSSLHIHAKKIFKKSFLKPVFCMIYNTGSYDCTVSMLSAVTSKFCKISVWENKEG
jgi:hypothetical protein